MVNDIAYNNMRGGSVIWKKNGSVVTPSNGDNPFTPDVNFADGFSISSPSTDTITAEVTLCRTFNWGTKWGIVMTDWAAAKNVTIEVWDNVAGSWATAYTATNDTNGFHWAGYSAASGHAMTKVRYTLSNFRSSDVRITQMFVVGYDSTLLSGPFMNRNGGAIYGSNASPVTFTATGGDSNIGINLVSKGSGTVQANGVQIADLSSSQTFTNKTLTTPKITTIKDTNGNTVLDLPGQPSAVNNIYFGNHSSGNSPVFGVAGSDTDISLSLQTKGTGVLYVLRSNGHSTVQAGGGYNSGNVNLELNSQGTGVVRANGVQVADLSSTQTLTNKTIDGASNTITNIPASAIPGDINGRVLAQSAGIINF